MVIATPMTMDAKISPRAAPPCPANRSKNAFRDSNGLYLCSYMGLLSHDLS